MRKSKFNETQIVEIFKEAEAGGPVADLLRNQQVRRQQGDVSNSAASTAGATVSDVKRRREPVAESTKLKRMYADLALENAPIKDVPGRKL